ncbi:MAG: MalY/PatB family protein [Clostridia bacterium]|nr:MalY/PatB family protein [Clostridia bacterium]
MNFDFTSVLDRMDEPSFKWNLMKGCGYPVPAGTVPFSTAEMEFPTPPAIRERLTKLVNGEILGYTSQTERYEKAVFDWMRTRHGYTPAREELVTSPGIVMALYMAVRAFTEPGDGVIIQTPVYPPFFGAVNDTGRKLLEAPLAESGDTYVIDFDALEKAASDPSAKLFLLCSPHNPVGRVWTKEELEKIAAICEAHDIFVIADEIHNDLILPGSTHTVFANINEWARTHSVVCTAPSKTFNIPGLQCSNLFCADAAHRAALKKEYDTIGLHSLNVMAYSACVTAYEECAPWLEEALKVIRKNDELVHAYLAENIPEIRPFRLEGTYLSWWDCRALGMDRHTLYDTLRGKAAFYPDGGYRFGGEGFIRVNIACPESVLTDALERLKKALKG